MQNGLTSAQPDKGKFVVRGRWLPTNAFRRRVKVLQTGPEVRSCGSGEEKRTRTEQLA